MVVEAKLQRGFANRRCLRVGLEESLPHLVHPPDFQVATGRLPDLAKERIVHVPLADSKRSTELGDGYPVAAHETLFGLVPLASRLAQRLLQQVRPWIEPAQSFEKNQLGLGQMFFNSLRLAWQMSLWAESAVPLRTMAWLDMPTETHWLRPLMPRQMELGLGEGK